MMNEKEFQSLIDCITFLFSVKDSLKEIKILDSPYKYMLNAMLEILIEEVNKKE